MKFKKDDKVYYKGIAYIFKRYLPNGKEVIIKAESHNSSFVVFSKDLSHNQSK